MYGVVCRVYQRVRESRRINLLIGKALMFSCLGLANSPSPRTPHCRQKETHHRLRSEMGLSGSSDRRRMPGYGTLLLPT